MKFILFLCKPVNARLPWLLSLLLSGFYINAQVTPYRFNHLTVDDGLSHTDAIEVKQDKLGYIWIATFFGLNRYDGYSLKRFVNNIDAANIAFKNRIRSLFTDKDGLIWLSTEDGVQCFNSKTESFIQLEQAKVTEATHGYFKIVKLEENRLVLLSQNKIRLIKINGNVLQDIPVKFEDGLLFFDFIVDSIGNVWIASNRGLWILNRRLELQHCIVINDKNANTEQTISKLFLTGNGTILFVSSDDIVETVQSTREILRENSSEVYGKIRYHVNSGQIEDMLLDSHKSCWISTRQGLLQLDANWSFLQFITSKSQNNGLISNQLGKLFVDRSECLWICSYGGGVNIADLNAKPFYLIQRNPELLNTLSANHITAVVEEDPDNIWIGTNLNGLSRYNFLSKQFFHFNSNPGNSGLRSNEIKSLVMDNGKRLWVGSAKGIQVFNTTRMAIEKLKGADNFPTYSIENLAIDYFGNIWFGSYSNGLGCIFYENGVFKTIFYNIGKHREEMSSDRINFIYCDKNRPEILVSMPNGLERLSIGNGGKVNRYFQYRNNGNKGSISSNYVWPVHRENDSVIWMGTLGGGLNKIVLNDDGSYSATTYGSKHGVFTDVESLQLDENGKVWMGGKGLQCFDPVSGNLIEYNSKDGLQGNSFKVGSSFKGGSGRLYFGGINGLNYFYPSNIKKNEIESKPLITEILVNGIPVSFLDSSENRVNIESSVSYARMLRLNDRQNNFIIYFSSMHFANPEKCTYRYKLAGFDKDWIYSNNRSVGYSNLEYSSYTFLLESTNNDGLWSTMQLQLPIVIVPPWWKSNFARIIYLLVFSIFVYGVYLYFIRWYRLKREFALRELEEKRREEFHNQKEELLQQQLQFFTNISHEFRTPLTLILGPLEMILKSDHNHFLSHHLEGMHRNAKRMMNLIAELMNFRKIAEKAITLHASCIEVNNFVQILADEFSELSLQKEIKLSTSFEKDNLKIWADIQVLEKILYNLINNAFKYTGNGGEIFVKVFLDISAFRPEFETEFKILHRNRASDYIYFLVKDNGVGISEEFISHVFDRYYRVDNTQMGSGVGLALVKSLVDLHGGDIFLYSQKNKGTEILVGIPSKSTDYLKAEIDYENRVENYPAVLEKITTLQPFQSLPIRANSPNVKRGNPNILIVEDNDELKVFLKSSLEPFFQISEAANGQIALDMVHRKLPDLIISDVMMPVMDGFALCKAIKENFDTSHLPIILLTAKTNLSSQLEGVGYGADHYIAKPFSMDLLLLTIQNIFSQRKKLKELFAEGYYEDAAKLVQSDADKKLIQDLMELIHSNIDNEELDIEFICRKLHSSRSSLYEKVKNISGQSIGDFIRSARLKKALEIMTHENVSLQDVVERVGLNSSSYFTKAFKKEFGKSPTEFLRDLKK